jgi:2'-hydroxyisoflavone reductase
MKVLVLGGTAFFGKAIVDALVGRGDDVTVFSRGNVKPSWWKQVGHVIGDRKDRESLRQLRGMGFDAVIDNIAYDGDDVRTLLDVIASSVDHYVLTSSSAVYQTARGYPPYGEEDVDLSFRSSDPRSAYMVGKLAAEHTLVERTDVQWTIIRPPVVVGPDDPTHRGWFYLQRLFDGGPVLVRCCADRSFRIVYSEDLAAGYLRVLDSPPARGGTYNITQEEIVTMRDLLEALADGVGLTVDLLEVSQRDLDHVALDYTDPYHQLSNFIPSVEKAQRDLGYRSTPFRDWAAVTACWYRDSYGGADSRGYERRDDELRLATELRSGRGGRR